MRRLILIVSLALVASLSYAREYADTAIYQGMNIKLDLATPIIEAASSRGKRWDVEMAMNLRLKQRFYPTLELGYANQQLGADSTFHHGQGGFARLGVDINGLKKHPERLDALLVGIRICTALQDYDRNLGQHYFRADCWGEVVAGCQVVIAKPLVMGWTVRLKYLFTEKAQHERPEPRYIPGFGNYGSLNWGFSYYIGLKL